MFKGIQQLSCFILVITAQLFAIAALADVKVDIKGVEKPLQLNILAHIGTINNTELAAPVQLEKKIQLAIRHATRAMGYYDAQATMLIKNKKISLRINSGNAVYFSKTQIIIDGRGAQLSEIINLIQTPPYQEGDRLEHKQYDTFKKDLLQILLNHGYLDAKYIRSELKIDLQLATAHPLLHLSSGERFTVGQVNFKGSQLNPTLLQRLSPLKKGEYISNNALLLLRRNLQDSKYFSSVQVEQVPQANKTLDINVILEDDNSHHFEVGAGFSTDTGPRIRFSWNQPQLNTLGHSSEVALQLSPVEQEISGRYLIPLKEPLKKFLQFDVGWQHKDRQDTDSNISTVGMVITDHFATDWRVDYSININYEEYEQGSQALTDTLYLLPGIALSKTFLPPSIDPLSGWRLWASLRGSNNTLGSETDFFRIHGQAKHLFDLGNNNTLLISRLELGAISSSEIEKIPLSLRFFTGGDQTVRGYQYESLAPEDSQGKLIGGRFLNVVSLELSHRFLPHWRAAVFTDAGRAYNDNSTPFSKGIGTGLRWLSPIGQIRMDLAFAQDDTDDNYRIHISMGPAL